MRANVECFSAIRIVSLACIACVIIMECVGKKTFSICSIVHALVMSISVVLLVPWDKSEAWPMKIIALVTMFSSMAVAFFACRMSAIYRIASYWTCSTLPLAFRFGTRFRRMSRDKHLITGQVAGWEMVMIYLNMGLAMVTIAWNGFAIVLAESWGGSGNSVLVLVSAVLYLFLYSRSITRREFSLEVALPKVDDDGMKYPIPVSTMRPGNKYLVTFSDMMHLFDDQQPFLRPGYTLDDLTRDMCSNRSYVSAMVRECTGMNFSQLLNRYRVRYSMDMFRKDPRLKVKDLAMMSGFGNTVSYGTAFRLFMDMTPGEWCDEYLRSLPPPERKAIQARPRKVSRKSRSRPSLQGG